MYFYAQKHQRNNNNTRVMVNVFIIWRRTRLGPCNLYDSHIYHLNDLKVQLCYNYKLLIMTYFAACSVQCALSISLFFQYTLALALHFTVTHWALRCSVFPVCFVVAIRQDTVLFASAKHSYQNVITTWNLTWMLIMFYFVQLFALQLDGNCRDFELLQETDSWKW